MSAPDHPSWRSTRPVSGRRTSAFTIEPTRRGWFWPLLWSIPRRACVGAGACAQPPACEPEQALRRSRVAALRLTKQHCFCLDVGSELPRLPHHCGDLPVLRARRDEWSSSVASVSSAVRVAPHAEGKRARPEGETLQCQACPEPRSPLFTLSRQRSGTCWHEPAAPADGGLPVGVAGSTLEDPSPLEAISDEATAELILCFPALPLQTAPARPEEDLPNPWLAIDAATSPVARALEVRRAWEGFLSGASPPLDLRAPITESWQRCASGWRRRNAASVAIGDGC